MEIPHRSSYCSEALSRKDPWPPLEVSLELREERGDLIYSAWIQSVADFDVPGLTLRGVVPAGTVLQESWLKERGASPGKAEEGEISWYQIFLPARRKVGPFFYRVGHSGDRNVVSRAWVERGGPTLAFSRELVWHPQVRMYAGHDHLMHRVPAYVALQKGWFSEEGINEVEIGFTGDDDHTVEAMRDGKADIGLDIKPNKVFAAVAKGAPIVIIAGWRAMDPYIFFGAKGLKSVEDLRGKKMQMREKDGVDVVHKEKIFSAHGLDLHKDVRWVESGPSLASVRKPLLDQGKVDAATVRFGDSEAQRLVEEGYPVLTDLAEFYPDGYQSRVLSATRKMVEGYPKTVKGVLKGIIRAYRFLAQAENHDEIHRILKEAGAKWVERDAYTYPNKGDFAVFVRPINPMDGSISRRGLKLALEDTIRRGQAPGGSSLDSAIDTDLVEEAARELGLR
jgi:ABC-type nitrate/sulfonate/bicarbonate transport system substrate-binding protein